MKISEEAKAKINTLFVQKNYAQTLFNNYLEGLATGMGIKGKVTFDMDKMEFVMEEEKKPEEKK